MKAMWIGQIYIINYFKVIKGHKVNVEMLVIVVKLVDSIKDTIRHHDRSGHTSSYTDSFLLQRN